MRYASSLGGRYSEAVMVPILITVPIFKQGQKKQVVYNETKIHRNTSKTSFSVTELTSIVHCLTFLHSIPMPMDMNLLLAPQCRTRWECTWTRWLEIRGSRSIQEIGWSKEEDVPHVRNWEEFEAIMRKKQRRVEAESEEIEEDPTWERVQIDWLESVWKALGIICKAPPLWN